MQNDVAVASLGEGPAKHAAMYFRPNLYSHQMRLRADDNNKYNKCNTYYCDAVRGK